MAGSVNWGVPFVTVLIIRSLLNYLGSILESLILKTTTRPPRRRPRSKDARYPLKLTLGIHGRTFLAPEGSNSAPFLASFQNGASVSHIHVYFF